MSQPPEAAPATPGAALPRFSMAAPVHALDGLLGRMHQVVIEPGTESVSGVVVRTEELRPRDLRLPLAAIAEVTPDTVRLRWNAVEARLRGACNARALLIPDHPVAGYAAGETVFPLEGGARGHLAREGKAPRALPPIRAGQSVAASDGKAGRVRHVLTDPATGVATHLVLSQGFFRRRSRLVPVEWVRHVSHSGITLGAARSDLRRLLEFRTDEEIETDIRAAWRTSAPVRSLLAHTEIGLRVQRGVVFLEGYAWSRGLRQSLEWLAAAVAGVSGVQNDVLADDTLTLRVAAALGREPRTSALRPLVSSYLGSVRLVGEAPDRESRDAAAEVAARVPRARSVENLLHLPGQEDEVPAPARLLEPRVGQAVQARDGPFGHVAHVVLSARTRRVIGIVVQGALPDPEGAEPGAPTERWPRRSRSLLVPAEWVDAWDGEVLLGVETRRAVEAPEVPRDELRRPEADWVPPFPYTAEQVLLEQPRPAVTARGPGRARTGTDTEAPEHRAAARASA